MSWRAEALVAVGLLAAASVAPARARAGEAPRPQAASSPPLRYGDPVTPAARSPLARRVEELVLRLSREAGRDPSTAPSAPAAVGPPALAVEPRLEAALDRLLPRLPSVGPPGGELAEQALALYGIIEPAPYLLTMLVPQGADDDVEQQLRRVLPPVLAHGRYRRLAVSTVPHGSGASRLALALQESFVELSPVPRALPVGDKAALTGRVLPPYGAPTLFVTAPDGKVARLEVAGKREPRGAFSATFRCGAAPGLWRVEVAAEDRFGDAVLANFPVRCGLPAPTDVVTPERAPLERAERAERDDNTDRLRDEVEGRVLDLLRRDRTAAGAPPLVVDPRLVAVARAHSAEMREGHFFGHISPRTGSALDRLTRAGVVVVRVRENLGRAFSAAELHRGLMESPSHRANMLSADVDRVGVGVAVGARDEGSGTYDLFLTQLFARVPEPFEQGRVEAGLRARVVSLRGEAHVPPLHADPALDKVAREVAAQLAARDGKEPERSGDASDASGSSDPIDRALPELSSRYLWVRRMSARALDVSQFGTAPPLVDKAATHAGYAAAAGRPDRSGATPVWLVVLLAAQR